MLTATVRRDGSSKFGTNNKWGTFPSVSVGWNITQESFMQKVNWLNDLKLSVGYGITGNQTGLDPYKTLELSAQMVYIMIPVLGYLLIKSAKTQTQT